MKYALARYDDAGRMFAPQFDGDRWSWHPVLAVPENASGSKLGPALEGDPPERKLLATADGWRIQIYWFNDDGGCPDPRPGKRLVSRTKGIPFNNPNGRPRTPDELRRDVEHVVLTETRCVEDGIKRVTCCGPRDLPDEQACADGVDIDDCCDCKEHE